MKHIHGISPHFRYFLRGPAILAALMFAAQIAFATEPAGAPKPRKLQVSDANAEAAIIAQGGRLVADYGAYRLYAITQPPASLASDAGVETRDDYDEIQLNTGALDTRDAAVKSLSKTIGDFPGRRLHLVQFAGPVRPAWREGLIAAGVEIVNYIPQNAYLLYGDASSLARVQALAKTAAWIQWEGPFADAYKIHPDATAVDSHGQLVPLPNDDFAVQLVADPTANPATVALLNSLKLGDIRRENFVLNYHNVIVPLTRTDLATVAARPDVISITPYYPREKFCERQAMIVSG